MSIAEKSKAASQSGVMPLMTALGYYGIAWAALVVGMVAASLAVSGGVEALKDGGARFVKRSTINTIHVMSNEFVRPFGAASCVTAPLGQLLVSWHP